MPVYKAPLRDQQFVLHEVLHAVEKLQHDLYYVKNNSLFLDIMIMIATVEVVLWGRGAR